MAIVGLANGDIKLLHVVQALGDYLTSEDDDLRNKGKNGIAWLLASPNQYLSRCRVFG